MYDLSNIKFEMRIKVPVSSTNKFDARYQNNDKDILALKCADENTYPMAPNSVNLTYITNKDNNPTKEEGILEGNQYILCYMYLL